MSAEVRPIVKIRPAVFPADRDIVSHLFLAYAQSLPIALDFQNFDHELANLPGKYDIQEHGGVWLAYTTPTSPPPQITSPTKIPSSTPEASADMAIGCVALRSFPACSIPTCELKRLYIIPSARGMGVSKILLEEVLNRARELAYKEMLLDTLSSMAAARKLYEGYGFREMEKYYESVEGAVFYRLVL
ncbi:acyl-CoA N-acyltransferase [Paraphoma chrysanthemicola]|uniref:Acyl-CoA N-acyltransferase n=1 Tax=Paraphoma chrysanthemicola TaxID=798071 RepID=A0A8K0VX65_9PLEO|nr:acyl-CoA N-acyltransferase [Paraphoma chrysanthemicola]